MSAIRQSVAVGFILWALMDWEDLKGWKRYIVYISLIIAAMFFHNTAIVASVLPLLSSRKYTRNTTVLIIIVTLIMTSTNLVSSMISFIDLGKGYVTAEIGNAVNVGVVSLLYLALLLLRLIAANRSGCWSSESNNTGNTAYSDDFLYILHSTILGDYSDVTACSRDEPPYYVFTACWSSICF